MIAYVSLYVKEDSFRKITVTLSRLEYGWLLVGTICRDMF